MSTREHDEKATVNTTGGVAGEGHFTAKATRQSISRQSIMSLGNENNQCDKRVMRENSLKIKIVTYFPRRPSRPARRNALAEGGGGLEATREAEKPLIS